MTWPGDLGRAARFRAGRWERVRRYTLALPVSAAIVAGGAPLANADETRELLRNRIEVAGVPPRISSGVLASAFEGLLPAHPGYGRLRAQLARYRVIERAGGWPVAAEGEKLQCGDRGSRVEQTRRRLETTGDPRPTGESPTDVFDDALEEGVRRQRRSSRSNRLRPPAAGGAGAACSS